MNFEECCPVHCPGCPGCETNFIDYHGSALPPEGASCCCGGPGWGMAESTSSADLCRSCDEKASQEASETAAVDPTPMATAIAVSQSPDVRLPSGRPHGPGLVPSSVVYCSQGGRARVFAMSLREVRNPLHGGTLAFEKAAGR